MTRSILPAALIALLPALAAAQAPFPGAVNIDGGWVPCSHPIAIARGLGCAATPAPTPPAPAPVPAGGFIASAETCNPQPNPYAEPAKAAACSAWDLTQRPRPALPTYDVGATYRHPYQAISMAVLGIGSTLEGVPVVTAQYVGHPDPDLIGQVFAFRIDQGQPWTKQP